ncbi:hypothetical protein PFICI_03860 [Pestalotiopsis fici W106-1]|uniref:Amine oxidase domain-containing protein n=1 Tax=Pestalotiopsis fici (strain W106-1 / CGMCC3.15140) TaxID=1229662 RepID=W3XII6_PESFW|nr:uncharacterized protein PFICI_03860 [Pestalotiopsis fici W106-1]ETS85835.1 hypothetical protein PFICI_03860 [Pestalotiopsis fici W106-1]
MKAPILSFRSQWASRLVKKNLLEDLPRLLEKVKQEHGHHAGLAFISEATDFLLRPSVSQSILDTAFAKSNKPLLKHRICIVGAGVTGLFIAMLLDSLNIPGLEYDILEASDKTGGRIRTHYFSDEPHDYYDIGAMRFPDIVAMRTTFQLFEQLDIPLLRHYHDHKDPDSAVKGSINCPTMYNGITIIDGQQPGRDPFRVGRANGGSVPDHLVDRVNQLLSNAFEPFKRIITQDFEAGFKLLMRYDSWSTREFLRNPPPPEDGWEPWEPLDFFTGQWLETNTTSTSIFDQAFSESVMDSLDFSTTEKSEDTKWYCIDGGSSLLSQAMEKSITQPVQHGMRVEGFSQNEETNEITVCVAGEPEGTRLPYSTVFNTTSLACLQRMDLTRLQLHPTQRDAIRTLHYDDSTKVAMKFSYPWWRTRCGITAGGFACTDAPLRTCVYPSYNLQDPTDQPAVLLCSYTWAQDATRIGSLIQRKTGGIEGVATDDELRDLMLDNLARLHLANFQQQASHSATLPTLEYVLELISQAYISHHAFNWSQDPFTSGAFALFGPGQFSNLYPYLSRPAADSRFHICGEASSAHHAWVSGSLDNALASMHRFLIRFGMWEKRQELKAKWDTPGEIEDGVGGTLQLQVALGMVLGNFQCEMT